MSFSSGGIAGMVVLSTANGHGGPYAGIHKHRRWKLLGVDVYRKDPLFLRKKARRSEWISK